MKSKPLSFSVNVDHPPFSPLLLLSINDRFSDSEAARVKSATHLVGGLATSTLQLQDGITKMACE